MTIHQRKEEHIQYIMTQPDVYRDAGYFDHIKLIHRALPELNLKDVDTSTNFLGRKLSFPLIISPMTGGASEKLESINRNIAKAAQATGIAMSVGSQRIMIEDLKAENSFSLRQYAPHIPLMANLGAVQLNYGFGKKECQRVIDVLNADALYLHLNPLQEALQKEGNTEFRGLITKIQNISQKLTIPIIIKEVGCGISAQDAQMLQQAKIKYIDVAGSGGTSFAYIEGLRSQSPMGEVFKDFGIPTTKAIFDIARNIKNMTLIASGGIRNGLDMAKAIILGSGLCAMANPFLKPALESDIAVIEKIYQLHKEFQIAMFVLGQSNVQSLQGNLQLIQNIRELENGHWYK